MLDLLLHPTQGHILAKSLVKESTRPIVAYGNSLHYLYCAYHGEDAKIVGQREDIDPEMIIMTVHAFSNSLPTLKQKPRISLIPLPSFFLDQQGFNMMTRARVSGAAVVYFLPSGVDEVTSPMGVLVVAVLASEIVV